jgi:hypothetical protein
VNCYILWAHKTLNVQCAAGTFHGCIALARPLRKEDTRSRLARPLRNNAQREQFSSPLVVEFNSFQISISISKTNDHSVKVFRYLILWKRVITFFSQIGLLACLKLKVNVIIAIISERHYRIIETRISRPN